MTRRVWRVVGLSGVGVLALAAAFGLGARWASDHGSDVALPPDDATPCQVARAHLDAVNADDERVLRLEDMVVAAVPAPHCSGSMA